MNGLQKECTENLLEIWRTRIRTTYGGGWEKVIWKDALRLWYVVPWNSLYGLTISSTILAKLSSHPFIRSVVQEMRLYLIQWVHVANFPKRSTNGWQFFEKLGFNRARLWHEHKSESLAENEKFKILWDFTIQCDHRIEARRPDGVVVDKVKKEIDYRRDNTRRYKSMW